jgi:hypothetical protein
MRWIPAIAAFAVGIWSVGVSVPVAAQQETCVTVCQEKSNRCAESCVNQTSKSLAGCQLACARKLFQACVDHCEETGEVVEDGYEIVGDAEK